MTRNLHIILQGEQTALAMTILDMRAQGLPFLVYSRRWTALFGIVGRVISSRLLAAAEYSIALGKYQGLMIRRHDLELVKLLSRVSVTIEGSERRR
jgi:hypothetical protein